MTKRVRQFWTEEELREFKRIRVEGRQQRWTTSRITQRYNEVAREHSWPERTEAACRQVAYNPKREEEREDDTTEATETRPGPVDIKITDEALMLRGR